jgi:hypothetical protein
MDSAGYCNTFSALRADDREPKAFCGRPFKVLASLSSCANASQPITDQITDQYAPYCSELRYAVLSEYRELADYWWMQQEMNTLSVRHKLPY